MTAPPFILCPFLDLPRGKGCKEQESIDPDGLDLPDHGHVFFGGRRSVVDAYMKWFNMPVADRWVAGQKLSHVGVIESNWLKCDRHVLNECVTEMKEHFSKSFIPLPGYLVSRPSSCGPFMRGWTSKDFYDSKVFRDWFGIFFMYAHCFAWVDCSWIAVKTEILEADKLKVDDGPRVFVPQGRWMNAYCSLLFRSQNDQLKNSPFYSGGWHPFHGKFEMWVHELDAHKGFLYEEDCKKFDVTYAKFLSDAVRDVRSACLPVKFRDMIEYAYHTCFNSLPVWVPVEHRFSVVSNILGSGCFLTAGDNSLRNFIRWFYHMKRCHNFTLSDFLERVHSNIMGDDSLMKIDLALNEIDLVISSAHLGIVSKGFTRPPSDRIGGFSFLGVTINVEDHTPVLKWKVQKLVDSCRFSNGLSTEDFYDKIYTILVLLSTDRDSFRMVKHAAVKYFHRSFPRRSYFLKYYDAGERGF